MSVRLFVGNLDYSVNEAELRQHFGEVGAPAQVALPVDRETGRPRGFAFVEFADRAVAEEVIRRFNGQALKGRPLAISEARAREDRPPMSGPRPPGRPFSAADGRPAPLRAASTVPAAASTPGGPGGPAAVLACAIGGRPRPRPSRSARSSRSIRERSGGRVMDIEDMGGADGNRLRRSGDQQARRRHPDDEA